MKNISLSSLPKFLCVGLILPFIFLSTIAQAADLKVKRVILSTGGVGYFELEGAVEGNQELSFSVPFNQVDDILKSLVVADTGGGSASISTVGRRPLKQIFQDFPFKPTDLSSPAALLNRMKGHEVKVSGGNAMTGRVLQVVAERIELPNNKGIRVQNRATLLSTSGMRQFIVEDAESIEFTDPQLKNQIAKATRLLADHGRRDRREISIKTNGTGKRILQIGYVVGVPLWKNSYRLILEDGAANARLQGWAVVENLSGLDWHNIELSVVSGNPVTFRQALYEPYFVTRPKVPLEVTGRILPDPDDGDIRKLDHRGPRAGRAPTTPAKIAGIRSPRKSVKRQRSRRNVQRAGSGLLGAMNMSQAAVAEQIQRRMVSAAGSTATETTTQVSFTFKDPQTLASGFTAMLPIVDRVIPAKSLSHFQPRVHKRHPLASVRLDNNSESGLPPGILTLFHQDATGKRHFIGDARMKALPAGEKRLLSFAIDQKSKIAVKERKQDDILSITASGGYLRLEKSIRRAAIYQVDGPAKEARTVILQLPKRLGWKLEAPKAGHSETGKHHRFEVALKAAESRKVEIIFSQIKHQSVSIGNLNQNQLAYYRNTGKLSEEAEATLKRVGLLRQKVEAADRAVRKVTNRQTEIATEQKRLRANMGSIDRTSKLYSRYLKKLDSQETELETLHRELTTAQEVLAKANRDLRKFVRSVKF